MIWYYDINDMKLITCLPVEGADLTALIRSF